MRARANGIGGGSARRRAIFRCFLCEIHLLTKGAKGSAARTGLAALSEVGSCQVLFCYAEFRAYYALREELRESFDRGAEVQDRAVGPSAAHER